ncbi:MAG: hypothetical protein KME64_06610 [Scytonematopsis contorta HA4267-MV1]|jgi:hypothetical protein|nr:hypothetical protein [Scytonematopsis contorta HA4267-MV1]
MFFKRTAASAAIFAFLGVATVAIPIITFTVAPQVAFANQTFTGRGTFVFRGKTLKITSVNYQTEGKLVSIVVNLSNGQKMLLTGEPRKSNGKTVLIINSGGFGLNRENHQADISGKLNLNLVKNRLRSLNGSIVFDSQPISINFTSN